MGYFDSFQLPGEKPKGYFSNFKRPSDPDRARTRFNLRSEALTAQQEAEQTNSIVGTAKNAALDLGNKLVQVPIDFLQGTIDTYNEVGRRLLKNQDDTYSQVLSALQNQEDGVLGRASKIKNAVTANTVRSAGDVVIGVYAPISAAISSLLKLGGADKLINDTGQVIADRSGITDIPAFQQFAMSHPEAGTDFERLLNLATLGGAKPKAIEQQAKVVAEKLAQPKPEASPQPAKAPTPKPTIQPPPTAPEGQAINTRAYKLLEAARTRGIIDEAGEIPTHQIKKMADDLAQAENLIDRSPDIAKSIAMGDTVAPGTEIGSVYKALEARAIRDGDVNLIRELSRSKAPTEAGQALKAFDSIDPNSPVRIIREINAARAARIEKLQGKNVPMVRATEKAALKTEIVKTTSKRPKWEEFISEITCNY